MKKFDLAGITRGKLSGSEMGKYLIKHYFTNLLRGKENNPVTLDELKRVVNTLEGEYNIETYRKYEELLQFLMYESIYVEDYFNRIELNMWKISLLITQIPSQRPFEPEDITGFTSLIYETMDLSKELAFINAIFEMAIKYTGIDFFQCLMKKAPVQMNRVTNHYIFFSGTGLPLIKLYQITHETIEEALETVKDISDLYNEDKLKELLTNRGNK